MQVEELLKEERADILRIAAHHGASNVRIFGSVAQDILLGKWFVHLPREWPELMRG